MQESLILMMVILVLGMQCYTHLHLLIRELALECGYNAASIRERIYASDDPASNGRGFIVYAPLIPMVL